MSTDDPKEPTFSEKVAATEAAAAPDLPGESKENPPPETMPPPKADPEALALRARPRPVTRINRRVLILLAGTGMVPVLGATLIALDPPSFRARQQTGTELIQTRNVPRPDGLEELPRRYSDIESEPVPELGPPPPGDLGPAILERERELGIEPTLPFRQNPEDDAARAESIRQARIAQQARESGVFFQRTSELGETGLSAALGVGESPAGPTTASLGTTRNPFDVAAAGTPTRRPTPAANDRAPLELDRENDQNLQGRKLDFLNQGVDAAIYNPHALQDPASPYQVMAGTIIPASLVTGINSDLPGQAIAQVTEHIYDTPTGNHLLIPQGSRIIGAYDSVVAFGQSRALVVWQRTILPNGSSIVIENLPATDTAGYAGLDDEVDFHTWRLLKGVALSTLLGVSTELTFGDDESDLVEAIRESTQDNVSSVGQRITERNLNLQPTITIRPGWPLRIIANKDMILRPYRDGSDFQ